MIFNIFVVPVPVSPSNQNGLCNNLLSAITGVFVESSLKSAHRDNDMFKKSHKYAMNRENVRK